MTRSIVALLAAGLIAAAPIGAQPTPTVVIRLAERGDAEGLRAALADGAAPDARAVPETDGWWGPRTPLMAAARSGNAAAVDVLLAAGADPAARDSVGRTALWYAAQGDAGDAARRLLDAGADLDAEYGDGETAAGWAAFSDAEQVIHAMLDAGLDPDDAPAGAWPLLVRAAGMGTARHGNARTIDRLLRAGADPDLDNGAKWTPLLKAVRETPGGLLTTHLLVEAGADVAQTMSDHMTPAEYAVERDAPRIAAYYAGDAATLAQARLLTAVLRGDADGVTAALAEPALAQAASAAADAGAQGSDFYAAEFNDDGAPIHLAARLGSLDALTALLDAGATVDAQNGKGATALGVAAELGHADIVRALLASGADPDGGPERAFLGITPVHLAALGGDADILQALLDAGGEPGYTTNASMGYGYNALGFAIHHGHTDAVRVLLDADMETAFVGETGGSALDLALERDWPTIADLLRARGAQTTAEATQARIADALADGADWTTALADGDLDLARALLARGDAPPADALRSLLFSLQDDIGLIEPLVAGGADVDARGYGERTALHEAAANAFPELVEALLAVGADPALRDGEGRTPLDWARETNDPDTIGLLTDD